MSTGVKRRNTCILFCYVAWGSKLSKGATGTSSRAITIRAPAAALRCQFVKLVSWRNETLKNTGSRNGNDWSLYADWYLMFGMSKEKYTVSLVTCIRSGKLESEHEKTPGKSSPMQLWRLLLRPRGSNAVPKAPRWCLPVNLRFRCKFPILSHSLPASYQASLVWLRAFTADLQIKRHILQNTLKWS